MFKNNFIIRFLYYKYFNLVNSLMDLGMGPLNLLLDNALFILFYKNIKFIIILFILIIILNKFTNKYILIIK